jgi:hypothetical protein
MRLRDLAHDAGRAELDCTPQRVVAAVRAVRVERLGIDARADAAQHAALARVLAGELGGPWGIFSRTYQLATPVTARFETRLAQHDSQATIGDVVELALTKMRNPVTKAEAHPEVVLPEGLVVKRAGLAASAVFRVKDELALDHSGQYAAYGRFQYS